MTATHLRLQVSATGSGFDDELLAKSARLLAMIALAYCSMPGNFPKFREWCVAAATKTGEQDDPFVTNLTARQLAVMAQAMHSRGIVVTDDEDIEPVAIVVSDDAEH